MIVKLSEKYIDEIINLELDFFNNSFGRDNKTFFYNVLLNKIPVVYLIYKKFSKIISFIGFSLVSDEAEILVFGTKKEYRKKGYGKKLLNFTIKYIKKMKKKKIFLDVRTKNTPAISLYKKFNFNKIGIRKNYYNDDDAYLYELKI